MINDDPSGVKPTVYTIEMAYAHMRALQELANRSRAHQPSAAHRVDRVAGPRRVARPISRSKKH